MKIKKILKMFIPPIFLSTIRLFRKNKIIPQFYSTIDKHIKTSDTIIILGNGPSLKLELDKHLDYFKLKTCLCVNYFVLTDFYSIIKPKIYLLMDPNLFITNNNIKNEEGATQIFKELLSKTTWNMDLIVGSRYINNKIVLSLSKNTNINILFINQEDINKYGTKEEQFKLFNLNKIAVPAQNVINTAVYLGIFWRYKNIIMIGADTSFHEEIMIDQITNTLYIEDKHFYGTKKRLIYKDDKQTVPFKIHELFQCFTNVFNNYWLLREYADYNLVKVFNASSKSYIDSFERITIEEYKKNADIQKSIN